jgi:hypothetical protein
MQKLFENFRKFINEEKTRDTYGPEVVNRYASSRKAGAKALSLEEKESLAKKIRDALTKEGGAAGMDGDSGLVKHTGATEEEIRSEIEKMKDVVTHRDGDQILVVHPIQVVKEEIKAALKEKKGLWANIHAKRKSGKRPAKKGEKGYPKTLDIEEDKIKGADGKACWKGYKYAGTDKDGKDKCVPSGKKKIDEEEFYEVDAKDVNEEYCPVCRKAQQLEEKKRKKRKKPCKKAKGKKFVKRVNGRCRSFGQAGKAKGGGPRIRPGTAKGDAYCARSAGIKKCKNPPCANTLSRKKWRCRGKKSMKA